MPISEICTGHSPCMINGGNGYDETKLTGDINVLIKMDFSWLKCCKFYP